MKIRFFIPLAALLFLVSCSKSGCGLQTKVDPTSTHYTSSNRNTGILSGEDSTKVLAIEKYTTSISKGQPTVRREKIAAKIYDDKDYGNYTYRNDSMMVLVTTLYPPDAEFRDFYFFDENGKIVMHKHREWMKLTHPPLAKEVVCYMDDAGVFYTMERRMELGLGDNPSPMLRLPFTPLKLNPDSLLEAIYAKYEQFQAVSSKK